MAETLQRVDELRAPPVVGQFYLVPTVRHYWNNCFGTWPVMGPKHEDFEHLRFASEHYHLDARFLSPHRVRTIRRRAHEICQRNGVIGQAAQLAYVCAAIPVTERWSDEPLPKPVHRVERCYRSGHAYPLARTIGEDAGNPGFRNLHAAYAGRRCGRDAGDRLICPHKGFALDSLVPDAQGRVVCPLHGLVIDTRAGVVVSADAIPDASHVR